MQFLVLPNNLLLTNAGYEAWNVLVRNMHSFIVVSSILVYPRHLVVQRLGRHTCISHHNRLHSLEGILRVGTYIFKIKHSRPSILDQLPKPRYFSRG